MSIDREFKHLNKKGHYSFAWNSSENSVEKWIKKPSKMIDFIKFKTVKILIPALILAFWWKENSNNMYDEIKYDESRTPLALEECDIDIETNPIKINSQFYFFNDVREPFDENFWFALLDESHDNNYISGIHLDENFDYAPWTHILQTTKEILFQSMYKKLSFEDYQVLFKWLKNLKQWALGNCYFVATIKNLARSKYFDTLMMTSLERTWEDSFNLYMPLWEPWWMKIKITSKDIESATIRGPLWYKILEVWFSKYLLCKKWIISSPNIIMTKDLMKKMAAWGAWLAMRSLLWPKSFTNKFLLNNSSNKEIIINWLRNYDPKDLSVISVSSKFKEWKTDQNSYEVWWETIYYGHAYCLCGIEKEWDSIKNIVLDNPWNNSNKKWWRTIKLSLDDFFESFFAINIGHITDNFMNYYTLNSETKIIDNRDRNKH